MLWSRYSVNMAQDTRAEPVPRARIPRLRAALTDTPGSCMSIESIPVSSIPSIADSSSPNTIAALAARVAKASYISVLEARRRNSDPVEASKQVWQAAERAALGVCYADAMQAAKTVSDVAMSASAIKPSASVELKPSFYR
jgi:hypothetical protein